MVSTILTNEIIDCKCFHGMVMFMTRVVLPRRLIEIWAESYCALIQETGSEL